eukprot:INCI7642.3.p2 GENE.INCI7642.3~~INCI7642.3.p2  ORF type:complete len:239 (+),score=47.20 INCI7642.3:453-1169(+)
MPSSRVVAELETAKAIDKQTAVAPRHQGLVPSATVGASGGRSGAPSTAEIDARIASTRSLLQRLSHGLSNDVELPEDTARLFRQLQTTWELQLEPLVAMATQCPVDVQQRLQLVAAERDKITREVEAALEARAVEDQLVMLQRCTRQLVAAQQADSPDPDRLNSLSWKISELVAEIQMVRTATSSASTAGSGDIAFLVAQAQETAARTAACVKENPKQGRLLVSTSRPIKASILVEES